MNIDAFALDIWIALTALGFIALAVLALIFTRVDRTLRRRLEERLARGEIDFDDYRERIALLGG
jgi:uncharacterized membrane protein